MALEEKIEIIGLPDEGRFKIVQLFMDKHPVMLCASTKNSHQYILGDYLKSKGIDYALMPEGEHMLPSVKGERYEVVGMGECEIKLHLNFFQLPCGKSYDYSIGPNEDFNEQLKKQFEGWFF